jgi:spermidine synthase
LRTAENFWTPAQALRFASVHRALAVSLPHIVVLPGAINVVLASRVPLPDTAAPLVERFEARGIRARLVHPAYLEYLFSSDRREEIETILASTRAPANTDTEPVCYRYALMLWVGRFWPALAGIDPRAPWATRAGWQAGLVAVVVVLVLVWAGRRRAASARAVYVGLIALSGMLVEGVVLMHFQVTQGVMFQDIGVLVAGFMAGLALGTWAVARAPRSSRWLRFAGYGTAGLLAFAAAGLAGLAELDVVPTLTKASLALAVTGGLVGAGFGWASLRAGADQRGAIAPLYAADLIGGSVGAVVGGLLLIPLLGLTATALVGGALALVACALA